MCAHIVLKCNYLARVGRPDILWSVHKHVRAMTKWTGACDKRLSRLISYIHHTSEFKQYCHVGNTAQQCRLGLFQDSDFAGDLEDSKSTSGGILCIFGSHTFVPIRWTCKKHTSVSHSPTEADIISLGYRIVPLFPKPIQKKRDSWAQGDLLHHTMSSKRTKNQTKAPTTHDSSDLFHVDNVPSHAKFSQSKDMLYVFEDNEAVIKMIVKGRSPTMRHVSRTHRVALDWFFDRINLEPKIQIRYIDTKHQIADILTKGKFTRDAWNILLLLFNITHFSSLCCAKNISMISCTQRRAKRMQEQKEENRVVANLAVSVSTSSSSVNSPIASRSPKLQVDRLDSQGDISTRRLVAADKDQEYLNHQERISTGELVAPRYQGYPENPQTPEDSEKSEPESRTWPHHFRISPTLC